MSDVGVWMPLEEVRQATLVNESGMGGWEELIRLREDLWRSPLTGPELL